MWLRFLGVYFLCGVDFFGVVGVGCFGFSVIYWEKFIVVDLIIVIVEEGC